MPLLPISIAVLRIVVPFHTHSCSDHWVFLNDFSVGRAAMKWKSGAVPIPILKHDVTAIYGSVPSLLDYKACQESLFPLLGFFILGIQKSKLVFLLHIQRMNSDSACLWEQPSLTSLNSECEIFKNLNRVGSQNASESRVITMSLDPTENEAVVWRPNTSAIVPT